MKRAVKILARKKREDSGGRQAPWLNTFADLMNLLLCFFVMLFAMSDVNKQKFQDMAISLSNTFGIFDGKDDLGEGPLITSGMSQLNNLGEYYSSMDEQKSESDSDVKGKEGPTGKEDTRNTLYEEDLDEAYKVIEEKMQEVSGEMYKSVEELTEQLDLGNYVELSIDSDFRYVQIAMRGSVLFDPGKADIRPDAKEILSKIGDILKNFDGYIIEIIGHTDNVPVSKNNIYKNNNWLSSARALNAAEFLIENNKLDPKMLKYSGRGEYEPVADNSTAEGRAKNRRIEIRIYNEYSGR